MLEVSTGAEAGDDTGGLGVGATPVDGGGENVGMLFCGGSSSSALLGVDGENLPRVDKATVVPIAIPVSTKATRNELRRQRRRLMASPPPSMATRVRTSSTVGS